MLGFLITPLTVKTHLCNLEAVSAPKYTSSPLYYNLILSKGDQSKKLSSMFIIRFVSFIRI